MEQLTRRKFGYKVVLYTAVVIVAGLAVLFFSHEFFDLTSSNSSIYFLKGETGGFHITRDLFVEDADRLVFMVDASDVFTFLMKGLAFAKGKPVIELTWDHKEGVGSIKQFRPDGTILALTLSRFVEDFGRAKGLFIGGELPYGDASRSRERNTSGFSYFDGDKWNHIWCALNEGFTLDGSVNVIAPSFWRYAGSRVLKSTASDVMIESTHDAIAGEHKIIMKRLVVFRAGDDFFTLRVKYTNASPKPLIYSYAIGDEPWVGNYGTSRGDVGWYDEGTVMYEKAISTSKYNYAGFWDVGNPAARENGDGLTGLANFIQWPENDGPSYAFFSNSLGNCCNESMPLLSEVERSINVAWLQRLLMPGESKEHTLIFGMAAINPQTGRPQVPQIPVD